jgi:hypothetical protein
MAGFWLESVEDNKDLILNAPILLTDHIDHLPIPFRVFLQNVTMSVHDSFAFLLVSSNGERLGHG